jgi:hypothetical protein
MGCPHPGIECEDCAEVTCKDHPDYHPRPQPAIPACARGDSCSLAQIVSDFIRRLEEEEALTTGDVDSWTWAALHEKGAGHQ